MGTLSELSIKATAQRYESPREWVERVESELWKVLDTLDKTRLTVAKSLREDPESHGLKRFSGAFDQAKDGLEKLLLDVLCPQTTDQDEGE